MSSIKQRPTVLVLILSPVYAGPCGCLSRRQRSQRMGDHFRWGLRINTSRYPGISMILHVEEIKVVDLPDDWQEESAYLVLQRIGKEWLLSDRTPVLRVPSSLFCRV